MKFIPGGFGPLVPLFLSLALVLGGTAFFSGCYTLKQGTAMLGYLGRAVPLETLESPESGGEEAERDRAFAERVRDIRAFAMGELGLRETKNYTRYVQIDRDYLAAVVSAAAKDSFARHEWWFPVVGRVPYKGFFNPADARKEAAKLAKKDLDVWIRGVDAFSTLGWFADPLYSYMRDYPVHRLADLLIHELLHATVYLKGQSQFNEELAEFVGREGARLYLISRFGGESGEYRAMADGEADSAVFLDFIRALIAELEAVYQEGAPREEKLEKKEAIIGAAQEQFEAEYESRFRQDNYRGFSKMKINNAYLELYRLYYGGSAFYEELYEKSGRDLRAFIAAAKTLKGKGDPKQQMEAALELSQSPAGLR
ncbi:MAG: aminopeptidase [Spirochaetaceae bacterium]|jgi:predicted aminopeptidase|nr:aminopeptidase [Spirochaetaceae bacterium]